VLQRAPVNRRLAAHRALGDVISTNVRRRVWHRSSGVEGRDDSVAAELEAQGWADIKSFDVVSAAWDFRRAAELSTSDGQRGRRLLIAARQEAQLGMFDESMASSRLAAECELEDIDRGRTELVFPARARGSGEFARLCDHAIRAAEIGDEDLLSDLVFEITRESFRSPATYEIPASLRDTVTTRGGAKRDWRSVAALALSDPVGRGSLVRSEFATLDRNKLSISDGLVTVALGARAVGSYEFCALVAARAISEYRTRRMVLPLLEVLSVSADVQLELGNWEMANSQIAQAFILAGPLQDTHLYAELLVTAAKSAALCGDSERAIQLITQVEQTSFAHSGSAVLCRAEIARGISHLSSGKYLEATSILGRALDTRDRSNHPTERFAGLTYLAEAAVRSGDRRRIDEVVDELEQLACASELLETQLQYARSVLSGDSTAETVFVESLASEFSGSTWARARIQLAYGRWLRRNRQVSRSRGPLSAALETFESMGAVRWAREARDELSATGRRSSEDRRSDPAVASLSVQELKVARLAGEGLSNTEIGHQLSISARTVGAHLYRVYPKLDITSRRELAVRLSESVEIGELAGD
jgi:DNA-binding NarL/FixJ family response regulator